MQRTSCYRPPRVAVYALLAVLGACSKGADEMQWARAALERNAALEIVAADETSRTFTVRDKSTGELRVVRVDEIAAAPPLGAAAAPAAAVAAAEPAEAIPSAADAVAQSGESASAAPSEDAVDEPQPEPRMVAEDAGTAGGRTIASGPGYSIKAAGQPAAAADTSADEGGTVERRSEPLVCQGARFLRIDNRNIAFDGDALKAEEGCELYITNSRITANGVGLAARGASVHIKNSTVAGQSGAIHASGSAQIYAQSSRFRGMVRRLDDAVLHDMGDNVWN